MKLGTEGVQMVNNRDKIDPVLLKSIDHAGLKIEDMGEEQLKKVEEIALENGILGGQSSEKKKRIMSKPSNLPPSPKPPTHRLPTRVRQPPSSRPLPSSPAPTRPTRPPGGGASSSPSRRAGSPSTSAPRRGPPPTLRPPGGRPEPTQGGQGGPPPPTPPPPPPPSAAGGLPAPSSSGAKAAKQGGSLADQLKGPANLKPTQSQGICVPLKNSWTLKKSPVIVPGPKPACGDGGRDDLMSQIRNRNVSVCLDVLWLSFVSDQNYLTVIVLRRRYIIQGEPKGC